MSLFIGGFEWIMGIFTVNFLGIFLENFHKKLDNWPTTNFVISPLFLLQIWRKVSFLEVNLLLAGNPW